MPKPGKEKVTPETLLQIARLTGLPVDEDRAAELAPQVQAVRDGIDALEGIDLTDVEPATIFPFRQE